jgi:hypothetical protein
VLGVCTSLFSGGLRLSFALQMPWLPCLGWLCLCRGRIAYLLELSEKLAKTSWVFVPEALVEPSWIRRSFASTFSKAFSSDSSGDGPPVENLGMELKPEMALALEHLLHD